jgi:hypothetical protein
MSTPNNSMVMNARYVMFLANLFREAEVKMFQYKYTKFCLDCTSAAMW